MTEHKLANITQQLEGKRQKGKVPFEDNFQWQNLFFDSQILYFTEETKNCFGLQKTSKSKSCILLVMAEEIKQLGSRVPLLVLFTPVLLEYMCEKQVGLNVSGF